MLGLALDNAAAVPAGKELPVVIDMGVTVAAAGKIRVRANLNQKLPLTWGRDRHGRPTEDAYEAMAHGFLNWMGDHKGSALAVLANILSGVLLGLSIPLNLVGIRRLCRDKD